MFTNFYPNRTTPFDASLYISYLPTSLCKNPGDSGKKSRRFSQHSKKCQNYDFRLTNKSANNCITQKVLNFSKKGARKKKKSYKGKITKVTLQMVGKFLVRISH